MSDMLNITICDGKYTVIQDATGRTRALRYGEEWRELTGDNLAIGAAYEIGSLRQHVKELEAYIERLERAGDDLCEWVRIETARNPHERDWWGKAKESKP